MSAGLGEQAGDTPSAGQSGRFLGRGDTFQLGPEDEQEFALEWGLIMG